MSGESPGRNLPTTLAPGVDENGAIHFDIGVWVDENGAIHFDIEAMVRGAGYEPTPDNMRAMETAARDMAGQIGATVEEW